MKKRILSVLLIYGLLLLSACESGGSVGNAAEASPPGTASQTADPQTGSPAAATAPDDEAPLDDDAEEDAADETEPDESPEPVEEEPLPLGPLKIPNFEMPHSNPYGYADGYMVNGRYRQRDPDTGLCGYIDGTGKFVIPAQYASAEDFADGCAIVRCQDPDYSLKGYSAGAIDTNGRVIVPCRYRDIQSNGRFLVADNGESGTDFYSLTGQKLSSVDGRQSQWGVSSEGHKYREISFADGNPLIALQQGRKWALARADGMVTDALYDSISLEENCDYAVLKYGDRYALASGDGIIVDFGLCIRFLKMKNESSYMLATQKQDKDLYYAFVDSTGICSPFVKFAKNELYFKQLGNAIIAETSSEYFMYDTVSEKITIGQTGDKVECYMIFEDGTNMLYDGTPCVDVKRISPRLTAASSDYCTFTGPDGKYGVSFRGEMQVPAIYNTSEEAIAAFGVCEIVKENGKPIVGYGNQITGYTPLIQYHEDNFYYDQIVELGEGYYACRYNTTWYLLYADMRNASAAAAGIEETAAATEEGTEATETTEEITADPEGSAEVLVDPEEEGL